MKNLQDRIERLIDSVRDPKDVEALEIVQKQIEKLGLEQRSVQKENRRISAEILELTSRNKVLTQQVERLKMEGARPPAPEPEPDNLIEHLGVVFNRKTSGRFSRAVYCPKCHRGMKAVSDMLPFTCSSCRTTTSFNASELNDVILRLERG